MLFKLNLSVSTFHVSCLWAVASKLLHPPDNGLCHISSS